MLARGNRTVARALIHGTVPAVEHVGVLRQLEPVNTIVDIGANRGQFALAAVHVWPDAVIHAFEPLSRPADVFGSIFARSERVLLHRSAIGPTEGTMNMNVSARDDSSSLLPITRVQTGVFPGTEHMGTEVVDVRKLQSVIDESHVPGTALLKLDVQGFEYEALEGCETLLDRFTYVLCECSFVQLYEGQRLVADIVDWLASRNFSVKSVHNMLRDSVGERIQADFLFVNERIRRRGTVN